ncbi:MAG TPA: hypothetical protein VMM93_12845 [Vicinamibacterales bacterium]|nr:hypothetical protein [Vicinamibacterales bacterium]
MTVKMPVVGRLGFRDRRVRLCPLAAVVLTAVLSAQGTWTAQPSGVTARLRGVSAADESVVWASGARGTVLRSTDAGATWARLTVPGAERLDFRDVDAVSATTAYLLSIGNGDASRIYKTTDAGATWALQFTSTDPDAFFDAMAFWNADAGVAVSDSVRGQFVVRITLNGGRDWTLVPADRLPPALDNEGYFAASGTNVAVWGQDHVWLGTGAATRARVLRSTDRGATWQIADTPLAAGPTSGIYSIAFRDARHGIVVGGDYAKEQAAVDNVAVTSDGGATWTLVTGLSGFRSVVAPVPGTPAAWLAVGPTGSDVSHDDGRTWMPAGGPGYDTFSFAPGRALGWAAGAGGRVGLYRSR